MNKYLISIVIPTKNRQKYCIEVVKQIISLGLEGIEIVIQDNSDDNRLKEKIQVINSGNIIYNYHGGILSFVDNFSEAVSLATGEYVCMIGDDDGILPNIIEVTKFAKESQLDAIVPGLNAVYFWPSNNPIIINGENGYLCLSYIKNTYKEIDCLKGLRDLMKTGGQNYQSLDIPRVYHGIVKKEFIEKVRKITGNYFNGLTPDIYMSTALSLICKKVCRIGYPVTVSGICPKSGSSDSATGKHTGKLEDAPHFAGHDSYEWDKKVPEIYSVESIWAETVLHALNDFNAIEESKKFRVDVLDAICLKKYPQFSKKIISHAKTYGFSKVYLKLLGNYNKYQLFAKRVFKRLVRKKGNVKKFYNISNIDKAINVINEELRRKKYNEKSVK